MRKTLFIPLLLITLLLCSCNPVEKISEYDKKIDEVFGFTCDHCHLEKNESSNHIVEHGVDMTVCDECYKAYKAGEWTITQNPGESN